MTTIERFDTKTKPFGSLAEGETFVVSINSDDVFMKIPTVATEYNDSIFWNTARLNEGDLLYFEDNFLCIPVNINIQVSF